MKQHGQSKAAIATTINHPGKPPDKNMVWIPVGTFTMGSDHHYPEEAPAQRVTVTGFWMDKYAVTNKQFQRFVKDTKYITFAERQPNPQDYPGALPELLVPGSLVFQQPPHPVDLSSCSWWNYVPGANWRHPEGPGSSIKGRENYPVVHIAYEDAEAYAKWAGKALPTEAQWECAARGGLEGAVYVWGNEFPKNRLLANIWQGEFPWQNLKSHPPQPEPVGSYPANNYGLYDMAGNVWEWTMDWYRTQPLASKPKSCCIPVNPRGGSLEESFDPDFPEIRIPRKVLKGGSFLCAANYCFRYRPAARHAETVDTSTCHIGFRCVSST
ncbi:formylglycine-generating enzyme family protein [Nostoc sp. MS1]|uniref:formylglycine-generating enzyme family protein n=1 Tax=Nostoc sp. MS1 TaxID=2764711 RepID=UPI001CC6AABC|nr:formylglycine-generating enzyme family protein [Nostoc sp. MS1]BCL36086.1 hypothetical protein NSMS1_25330 [Nostoc sp. MS1]